MGNARPRFCWMKMQKIILSAMVVGFFLSSTGDCGGIMGKGLSAGMSRGNKGGNSNSGGRRTAQDFIDDMKRLDGDKQYGSSKSEDHSDDDEPCIGLCYYKKILEEEQNKLERDQASIEEDDVPSSTLNPSISSATSPKVQMGAAKSSDASDLRVCGSLLSLPKERRYDNLPENYEEISNFTKVPAVYKKTVRWNLSIL